MNQIRIIKLAWRNGELDRIFNDVLKTLKTTIIKIIEQELWPLMGMFDEIDNAIEQFEQDVRNIKETNEV